MCTCWCFTCTECTYISFKSLAEGQYTLNWKETQRTRAHSPTPHPVTCFANFYTHIICIDMRASLAYSIV